MKSDSYRSIMKVSVIHGVAQLIQLVFTLIRGKVAAVLLGPQGVGILNLFTSTLDIFTRVTATGFTAGTLPKLSRDSESNNSLQFNKTSRILIRLLILTGIVGGIFLFTLAPILSVHSFGNSNYTTAFRLLSVVLITNGITSGLYSIISAQRKVGTIAIVTVLNSLFSLLFATISYSFLGEKGIVPAMAAASLGYCIILSIALQKKNYRIERITFKETITAIPQIIRAGIILTAAALCGSVVTYLLNQSIAHIGTIADIGLYQSAIIISSLVTGVVLNAVGTDYLPRISAITDSSQLSESVSRQGEIVLAVSIPIATGLILFAPILVPLLLSDSFIPIVPLVRLIAMATLFKTLCYVLGFIPISRQDNLFFFWLEGVIFNCMTLGLNIAGYASFGLVGLGGAFLIANILATIVNISVARYRYNVILSGALLRIAFVGIIITGLLFILSMSDVMKVSALGITLLIVSMIYSSFELNRKADIKEYIQSKLAKLRH